jgi:hypothetical protein
MGDEAPYVGIWKKRVDVPVQVEQEGERSAVRVQAVAST